LSLSIGDTVYTYRETTTTTAQTTIDILVGTGIYRLITCSAYTSDGLAASPISIELHWYVEAGSIGSVPLGTGYLTKRNDFVCFGPPADIDGPFRIRFKIIPVSSAQVKIGMVHRRVG
jgi:hypothetical protein